MDLRWEILAGYGPLFVSGLWMTIQLTIVSIGAGLLLGVLYVLYILIAAWLNNEPLPVPADVAQACHPNRFALRALIRNKS